MSRKLTSDQKEIYREAKQFFKANKRHLRNYREIRFFNLFVCFLVCAITIAVDVGITKFYEGTRYGMPANVSSGIGFWTLFIFISVKNFHDAYIETYADEYSYEIVETMHDYAVLLPESYWKTFRNVNLDKLHKKSARIYKRRSNAKYKKARRSHFLWDLFSSIFMIGSGYNSSYSSSSSTSYSSSSSSSSRNSSYDRQRQENEAYYQRKRLQNEADWYERKAKNFSNPYDRQRYQNNAAYARNKANRY